MATSIPRRSKTRAPAQPNVIRGAGTAAAFFDGIERQQAKVSIPVAALDTRGVTHVDRDTVTDTGSHGGTVSVLLGAAAYRYVGDTCGIGPVPSEWPEELPEEVADMIAAAIPLAAEWIRFDPDNEKRVVFSGDLARGRGDDPVAIAKKYKATAKNSRLTAPPGR